jgi:hypothetical protein
LMRNLESASTPSSSLSTAVESGERSISSINLEERVRKMMDRVGGQVRHMVPVTATSATSSSVRSGHAGESGPGPSKESGGLTLSDGRKSRIGVRGTARNHMPIRTSSCSRAIWNS